MIIAISSLVAIAAIVYILGVRSIDLPQAEPVSPFAHLDERKAAIYDNLRDLQFEYRLGKLSDADYQATKQDLQRELAAVMAEVDRVKAALASGESVALAAPAPVSPAPKRKAAANNAWRALSGRFRYLAPLTHSVIPVQSGGRTLYRLRASGAGAPDICRRLPVAGESCTVVR